MTIIYGRISENAKAAPPRMCGICLHTIMGVPYNDPERFCLGQFKYHITQVDEGGRRGAAGVGKAFSI